MNQFHFRLQKVLEFREKQLELEESRFKQRLAALADLDRQSRQLDGTKRAAELDLRSAPSVSGRDLESLAAFSHHVARKRLDLAARRGQAEKLAQEQQSLMLEARRRCRLMERLRQRRLTEWEALRDKELDQIASESFLARWVSRDR